MTRLEFNAKQLASVLAPLMKAQGSNNFLEAYNDILFEGDAENLRLTAASDSVRVTTALHALPHGIPERPFRVKAKPLAGAIDGLPDAPVTISVDEGFKVTLKHGTGRLTIQGADGKEFPAAGDEDWHECVTLPAEALRTAIARVGYAVPKGKNASLRPILQGVALCRDAERLEAVASDSMILAVTSVSAGGAPFLEVIPAEALAVLPSYLAYAGSVELRIGVHVTRCVTENGGTMEWRRPNGRYPNYKSVMPQGGEELEIDRASLAGTLRRIALSAPESGFVRLAVAENALVVRGENMEYAIKGEETITCTWGGEPMEFGFSCSKLEAAVSHLPGDNVRITLTDCTRPALVTGEDGTRVVLMPMTL